MASAFGEPDDLIFPSEKGTPLDGNNMVRREFTPALRRARLPLMRFHDLRRSYASLPIRQGVHSLGHASIQRTLDRYGHLMAPVASTAIRGRSQPHTCPQTFAVRSRRLGASSRSALYRRGPWPP